MFVLDDSEKLSDVLGNIRYVLETRTLTVAKFKNIRLRVNQVLGMIWQEAIEDVYINDGKFEQLPFAERAFIFGLKRPTLTNFKDFKAKIEAKEINHPIQSKMAEILLDMSEIVDMVETLNEIGRIPDDISKSAFISSD